MEETTNKNTLNDILFNLSPEIDVFSMFPKVDLKVINHNKTNIYNDIKKVETLEDLQLSSKQTIVINKTKKRNTENISRKEKIGIFKFLTNKESRIKYFKKKKNQIILIEYPKIPYLALDIRNYNEIKSIKKYPDLFIKAPIWKKIQKKIKRFFVNNREKINFATRVSFETIAITLIMSLALFLFSMWMKNYVLNETINQYRKLYAIKEIKDPSVIYAESIKIKNNFLKLKTIFTPVSLALNNQFYSNKDIKTASNVIFGWSEMWELLNDWVWLYSEYLAKTKKWEKIKLTDFLKDKKEKIIAMQKHFSQAVWYYEQVSSIWSSLSKEKFDEIMPIMRELRSTSKVAVDNYDTLLKILWDSAPQKFLVLNQNRDEIRASWWFPGSVVNARLYKWQLLDYEKKDIYYYDWNLFPYKETPPEWLNQIASNYGLRDANYNISFQDNFQKLNFFYEKSGWWTLDTIIAINQWIVIDILKKIWPIHMDTLWVDIDYKNFSLIMSVLVEAKIWKKESPKDILFEFSKKFEEKVKKTNDYVWYAKIILDNVKKWEILVASRDPEIQKFINELNLFEKWKKEDWNWVYPVFTSLSGNKSDRNISRYFNASSKDLWNCNIENSFKIISINTFSEQQEKNVLELFEKFEIKRKDREKLLQIQWKAENKQFVRVAVPKGSKLLDWYKDWVTVNEWNPNFTVFSFYINTPVNLSSMRELKYTSVIKDCSKKIIAFYKQPWLINYEIRTE